ncbi:MAG: diguanylate cyclase [Candidatus Omnitrophica bacterium]|nr:diguanylate cyclase [Candidatus Omnitrophota bacterium]MBU4303410.1 diguanylate cyclase [Candidatus Omnitrophota bacterium]MBU4468796.1 diguanylate cyclase [Candidatus Omnitrophota bacterium]MCG2708083.1 diguanylate cyclase [Candidatus Omnitrophota bacterium]
MEDSKQNNLEITAGLLRKAELQQKAILDNIPDIAWLKDLQGRFIAVNELFAKACGLKVEEIIGKTDLDIWPKELALSYRANDQEVIDSKKRKCIQEKLVYPKGSEQWMETIKAPFFDDYGKVIGTTGISRNITLHKNEAERLKEIRAELDLRVKVRTSELASFNEALRKEVRFAQEAQKENDEKLEVLVQQRTKSLELEIAARKEAEEKANILYQQLEFILGATKTGLDIIDKDYNLRYVDPVWACNYGDWRGKKCFEYFMGRKSSCPECAIEEAFSTKKIVISEETLTREGDRPIQVTTIPYQDKNGEWLVVEVNVDITQKKKVDEELKRYRNHLEQLVEERTQDLLQETARCRNSEFEKSKLNRELLKTNEKLKSVSLIDAHTGLYNYRYLQEAIEVEFHQARRYAQNLAIIMLDIDYFKSINDVYGIVFGDLVLKQLAKQLKRMLRRYDVLVRYSGEEFIIISPRLNRDTAFNLAQRLLDTLNFINFGNKEHSVKLKMSLSVVSFPEDRAKNGMDLVNLADVLLNKVKESGGNRAYSSLDLKNPPSKGTKNILKVTGIKTLKNTITKLHKESRQGLAESIFAFAKTLELKDHYTGEHVENTVHFAMGVANELNLPKEDVELIKQAAMLHDLGKIGISESILLKKGKLNKKEFEEIKKHPQIGADIIRPIKFLHDLIPFIFYHHERWDGKGYPSGIRGEDIPLGARVIAIADVYQALISDRPYHKAFSKSAAIDIIKKSSGTQFDPSIVRAFLKVVHKEK